MPFLLRGAALASVVLVPLGLFGGCDGGGGGGVEDAGPDGGAPDAGAPPVVPQWDPGLEAPYEVSGLQGYYLIGNALTEGQDRLDVTVVAPATTGRVDAWVGETYQGRLEAVDGTFRLGADISGLGAGEHVLVLSADLGPRAFAGLAFVRTHPLYVVVSNDWDDPDNEAPTYTSQEQLHAWHSELRITHFVGPYTFTDPSVSEARAAEIVAWLLGMRDEWGDEIGLHIHPYCSFVEEAGLECILEPSYAYALDTTGYTVFLGVYDEPQTVTLLETAAALFLAHGLDAPTSFRAGGWTAEPHTLRALANAGHVVDASACNWSRLEEWEDSPGTSLYAWNREHWATIDETSQPYYPNEEDLLSSEPPLVPVLEVPDNGLLVDYVTAEEMIEMFDANWSGGALDAPRQYSIGYHPPNFSRAFLERIDAALDHADDYRASRGEGPVVYATMSELPLVWPLEG